MYQTYLWKIKPLSSYITPWHSDTIYGHLLWAISLIYGDEEVEKTIDEFKKMNSPFIVSNGFINGEMPFLKKSLVKRETSEEFAKDLNMNLAEIIKRRKSINKISSISLEEFNKLRGNYTNKEFIFDKLKENSVEKKEKAFTQEIVMHNIINRCSGSTTDNGLFFTKEIFTDKEIFIFIKIRKDYSIEKMKRLLKFVEDNGYGKKASIGKGSFKTLSFEKFDGFVDIKNADAFVVLSNYIPKEFDYEKVIYGTSIVKFGKVGNYGKNAEIPFKKPFSCFTVGSIFKNSIGEKKGKVLENIHYDEKIVQIGIPFTLGVKL